MPTHLPTTTSDPTASALDHAREFARIVLERTPALYAELEQVPDIRNRLQTGGTFNHGKLYAWAEFLVFRSEFLTRFPEASPAACINAFSRLFLKNDISMTSLAELMEPEPDADMTRLSRITPPDGSE